MQYQSKECDRAPFAETETVSSSTFFLLYLSLFVPLRSLHLLPDHTPTSIQGYRRSNLVLSFPC